MSIDGGVGVIKSLTDKYLSIWWNTTVDLKKTNPKVSYMDKLKNERQIEIFRKKLFKLLKEIPSDKSEEEFWMMQVFDHIRLFESSISSYGESIINFFIESGYPKITESFIDEVNQFDPEMDVYDIFQAIRNVWIMNSIQILYDMEVRLTPSIFAYSMLYPYSDNYLDDSNISIQDKIEFNKRFRKWLLGEEVEPLNHREKHIYNLVKKIEGEFKRDDYPEVFMSLLGIHHAQVQSLIQQKQKTLPFEKDIIGITFEKGGTSVLADAYLIRGKVIETESQFMFCYGVLLQIIDDLQDIEEDFQNSHMTIFSQIEDKYKLDRLVNKLFNFIEDFFHNENTFTSEKAEKLKKVIQDCSKIMIFEAISKNKKRFSKQYIKDVEESLVIRFYYLKKIKSKFQESFSSEDIIKICSILSKGKLKMDRLYRT